MRTAWPLLEVISTGAPALLTGSINGNNPRRASLAVIAMPSLLSPGTGYCTTTIETRCLTDPRWPHLPTALERWARIRARPDRPTGLSPGPADRQMIGLPTPSLLRDRQRLSEFPFVFE